MTYNYYSFAVENRFLKFTHASAKYLTLFLSGSLVLCGVGASSVLCTIDVVVDAWVPSSACTLLLAPWESRVHDVCDSRGVIGRGSPSSISATMVLT
jgi:hypothetical protein